MGAALLIIKSILKMTIKIKTKEKISKSAADAFNDEQEDNGLVRLNPLSKDDCYWLLKVEEWSIRMDFTATILWHQIQEYETGDPEHPIGEKQVLIYKEDFYLPPLDMQNLWELMGGEILTADILGEKISHFTAQGILTWCGVVRDIFGIGIENFEII